MCAALNQNFPIQIRRQHHHDFIAQQLHHHDLTQPLLEKNDFNPGAVDTFSASWCVEYPSPLPSITALFRTTQDSMSATIVTARWEEPIKPASTTKMPFRQGGSFSRFCQICLNCVQQLQLP